MTQAPRRRRTTADWADLLITAGAAAVIGSFGTYATDRAKAGRDQHLQQCQIAASFLSDDTISPYVNIRTKQRLAQKAATLLDRCVTELD